MLIGPNGESSLRPLQNKLQMETNMNIFLNPALVFLHLHSYTFMPMETKVAVDSSLIAESINCRDLSYVGLTGARGRVSAAIGANGEEKVREGQGETATGCHAWRYHVFHRPPLMNPF